MLMKIPSEYLPVMPYLILKDSLRFLKFVKDIFTATEQMIVPSEDGKHIMHRKEKSAGMYIYLEDVNHVYSKAMACGAKSLMLPEKKDYGYTAGFEDPFGNQWWIVEGEKE
jgi:PhnB protein